MVYIFQDISALKMEAAGSFERMAQSTNVLGVTSQSLRWQIRMWIKHRRHFVNHQHSHF